MIPPNSVLVVVTRRIGDVLLATPLIRSLKSAWPQTAIDVLVFDGTEGVLAANPDIRRVITIDERPRLGQHLALLWRIARRYDVALSVVPSDRPTLYSWVAARWRAGLVLDGRKHRWKTWLLQRCVTFDNLNTHTVLMNLALTGTLDIAPCFEVIVASSKLDRGDFGRKFRLNPTQPYAVLHPYPKFNYKMWRSSAWNEVAQWLQTQGMQVVLSGGGDRAELDYVDAIARNISGAINLAGRLSLAQAASLLAGARLYVGPDTALTHMAAALGVPVVALYGPSNPVKWGPWPAGYTRPANPWRRHGSQCVQNVTLIQGSAACAPCLLEGCDRHIASYSDCLQQLPPSRVITAIAGALAMDTMGPVKRHAQSVQSEPTRAR